MALDRADLMAQAFLIEDEVVLGNLAEHPIAQTLSDWKQRAVGRQGVYTLTLAESDLMLAMSLLEEYRERLRERTLLALETQLRMGKGAQG